MKLTKNIVIIITSIVAFILLCRLGYTFSKLLDNNYEIEQSIKYSNNTIKLNNKKDNLTDRISNLNNLASKLPNNNQEKQQIIKNISQIEEEVKNLPESIDIQSQIDLNQELLKIRTDLSRNYNSHITTIIQAIGAAFFLITAYFSWLNIKNTKDSQTAERLSKALEFISGNEPQKCLTGIYLLENLIEDSQENLWSVIRILADLIKNKSRLPSSDREEYKYCIHKAIGMIAYYNQKINRDIDKTLINLQGSYLKEIKLYAHANLEYVNLDGANLEGAVLPNVQLNNSSLKDANLKRFDSLSANFQNASLDRADLSSAGLFGADFTGADIFETTFAKADIKQATFIKNNGFDPLKFKEAKHWNEAILDKTNEKEIKKFEN